MKINVDVADGKYSVIVWDDGYLEATRYGEPWKRDLVGDNLVYYLAIELYETRKKLAQYEEEFNVVTCDIFSKP